MHVLRNCIVTPDPISPTGLVAITFQLASRSQQPCLTRSGAGTSFGSSADEQPRLRAQSRPSRPDVITNQHDLIRAQGGSLT
jgi:hypothetical protein